MRRLLELLKGGPGSGNHGHGGRPGEVGGSTSSGGGGGKGGKGNGGKGKKTSDGPKEYKHSAKEVKAYSKEIKSEVAKGKEALAGIGGEMPSHVYNARMKGAKGRFTGAAQIAQDAIDGLPNGAAKFKLDEKLERAYNKASSGTMGREHESLKSAFNVLDKLAVEILQRVKTIVD